MMHLTSPPNLQGPLCPGPWTCSNLFNSDFTVQGSPSYPRTYIQNYSLCSTYGWQAGGWHPTKMLSCYSYLCLDGLTGLPITYGCICVAIFKTFSFKRLFNSKFFVIIWHLAYSWYIYFTFVSFDGHWERGTFSYNCKDVEFIFALSFKMLLSAFRLYFHMILLLRACYNIPTMDTTFTVC